MDLVHVLEQFTLGFGGIFWVGFFFGGGGVIKPFSRIKSSHRQDKFKPKQNPLSINNQHSGFSYQIIFIFNSIYYVSTLKIFKFLLASSCYNIHTTFVSSSCMYKT